MLFFFIVFSEVFEYSIKTQLIDRRFRDLTVQEDIQLLPLKITDKTPEIYTNALKYHGLDRKMHLTCMTMVKENLCKALTTSKETGI